jgi:CubicO group peptidase (beta-lactamase class C family)
MNTTRNHSTRAPKFILILLGLCLLLMVLHAPAYARPLPAGADFAAVDAYLEEQRESLDIPGMSLAIVQGDQVAHLGSYGEADSDGRPVTPQTPFQIGSTTKSFTALAVMQLIEAGLVELDAPVQTYLPWFTTADPAASAQITIRHLLNQTSGLSTATGRGEFSTSDLSDQAIENSVRALADVELKYTPGTTYEYSNSNFTIAGLVVQVVSGQSYESYVQAHIFDPLEMRHSFTAQQPAEQDGLSTGYVTFLGFPVRRNTPFNRGSLPNGYIFSSAEDIAHYLIAQLNDGRYGDASLLSAESMSAMHTAAVPAGTSGESYAMAWHVGTYEGTPVIYHSGDNAKYATFLLIAPEEDLGIALLINMNGWRVNNATQQLSEGVLAILLGKTPSPYQASQQVFLAQGSAIVPALVALLWIGWTVFRFIRRSKRTPAPRRGFMWWAFVLILPVLLDLVLLIVLLIGIPTLWQLPLNGFAQMFPDFFALIILSAAGLAIWGVLRTVLTLRQPHR